MTTPATSCGVDLVEQHMVTQVVDGAVPSTRRARSARTETGTVRVRHVDEAHRRVLAGPR